MAKPISTSIPHQDPKDILQSQLEAAPQEHAEAILAACEVLRGLHDRGVLELLRGLMGSSDQVLEIAVNAANTPATIRGLRNLLIVAETFADMDPKSLKTIAGTFPDVLKSVPQLPEPIGIWSMLRMFWSKDLRRGLSALITMLNTLGRKLSDKADNAH